MTNTKCPIVPFYKVFYVGANETFIFSENDNVNAVLDAIHAGKKLTPRVWKWKGMEE